MMGRHHTRLDSVSNRSLWRHTRRPALAARQNARMPIEADQAIPKQDCRHYVRSGLKPARTSSAKSCGCSQAA